MNPITGHAKADILGQSYTIRFDWDALAEVKEKHGENPSLDDLDVLASLGSIGMCKFHPEMTPEKIKELSPPVIPFVNDVRGALTWAYFGGEALPEDDKKKVSSILIGWLRRIKQRLRMGSTP
jgi:hypothetical protein